MLISDPLRLKQILINLVSNAVKFTNTGSVTVECEKKEINGPYSTIVFSVIDTGPGISESEIKRLFKPYMQAKASTERIYGGTGLGLVISDRLVRLLGGESIKIKSAPGGPTIFSFEIKMKNGRLKPVHHVRSQNFKSGQSPAKIKAVTKSAKILIVEDNLFNLILFKNMLEARDYEVIDADDGCAALDAALTKDPDAILIDIQIPELNGIEVVKKLRTAGKTMPIISISGETSNVIINECLKAGMNDCLAKPFLPEDIYRIIKKHLKKDTQNEHSAQLR